MTPCQVSIFASFSALELLETNSHQGGSILVKYQRFVEVGGYEPELFFGWSQEDYFFKEKLEQTYLPTGRGVRDIFRLARSSPSPSISPDDYRPVAIQLYRVFSYFDCLQKRDFLKLRQKLLTLELEEEAKMALLHAQHTFH
jgi:hypothetical protein